MEEEMYRGFKVFLLSLSATALFSGAAFAAGWSTNEQGQQVYQNDNGSVATNTWIKITQNGKTEWYYATANGSLRQDGWQKIGDSYYYFDGNGLMQTGWVQEDRYYCDPSSGKMLSGWKLLPLPEAIDEGINDMPQAVPREATITSTDPPRVSQLPEAVCTETVCPEEGAELLERADAIPTCGHRVAH